MVTIMPLSTANVRPLPEAIFGDPIRQRGGKGTMLKKRPKSGAGAGNPAAVNEGTCRGQSSRRLSKMTWKKPPGLQLAYGLREAPQNISFFFNCLCIFRD